MFHRKLAFLAFLLHTFSVSYCNHISCPWLFVSNADPPTGICPGVDLSYQTRCSFKCITGYQLKGSDVRVCQLDKTWSGTPTTCEEIRCPKLPSVKYAKVIPSICDDQSMTFYSVCTFSCPDGFTTDVTAPQKASRSLVCQLTGEWDAQAPQCHDYRPPTMTCPGPNIIGHTTKGKATGKVSWNIQVTDNSVIEDPNAKINLISTHQPSQEFPIGATDVQVTASDSTGNKATCSFTVKIEDVEQPTISRCPGDIMMEAPQRQVRVNWERPIFTDNSGIPVKVSSNKLSGDLFDAPGSYEVSYTASDSSGNTNNDCTFRITLTRGSNCTAGWTYYGSSCYYVKDTPTLKQSDARQHCQNLGGDLAIIKSEKQNDFIFSLIQGQNTFTKWGAWIGIQRKADGKFYWIDNTPVDGSYSIWAGGEPNNAGGSENCVQMYGQDSLRKKWNDFSCDLGSHVTNAPVILCQKPQV